MSKYSVEKRNAEILQAAERGMNLKQIADAFGISKTYVSQIIKATRKKQERIKVDRIYQLLNEAAIWMGRDLNPEIIFALRYCNIDTIQKLLALKDSDIYAMPGIGTGRIEIIHTAQELALAEIM